MTLEPGEMTFGLDYGTGEHGKRSVILERSDDMFLARQAIGESGTDDTGTVMVRLDVDGESYDRVLVEFRGIAMVEALGQALEAIECASDALRRLAKA